MAQSVRVKIHAKPWFVVHDNAQRISIGDSKGSAYLSVLAAERKLIALYAPGEWISAEVIEKDE